MIDTPPAIICTVVAIADADTITCQSGVRVRLAGISARERDGSCNSTPHCPAMRHERAQPIAYRLMLNRTIRFSVVGKSWRRIVADNMAVRCQLIASGAVVAWPKFERQYRLRGCTG